MKLLALRCPRRNMGPLAIRIPPACCGAVERGVGRQWPAGHPSKDRRQPSAVLRDGDAAAIGKETI
jgi:hypothetical protein